MAALTPVTSFFCSGMNVSIDPYKANPLADEVRTGNPDLYARASATDGQPPKMFAAGTEDLPSFLASGIDPALLMQFPYRCRHFIAAEPNRARIYELAEEYADDPTAEFGSPGLTAAVQRMRQWLTGRPPTMQELVEQNSQVIRDKKAADDAAVKDMNDDQFEALWNAQRGGRP